MANRRMVSKSISVSEQVNDLNDFASLLFTWMIPHTDDYGVIPGSSKKIKALIIPMRKQSNEHVETALKEMQSAGLIWRYIYKNSEFIQFCKFEEHQEGLHKRTKAKNPLYCEVVGDSENFQEVPGNSPLIEPNLTEEKIIEYKPSFDDFWILYPKKVSKNDAVKAWNKIKFDEELFNKVLSGLEKYKKSTNWLKDNGQFIPNCATWLNGERWNDEVDEAQTVMFGENKKTKYTRE